MKTSKLLNKFILILLLYSFSTKTLLSNEPVDIWEIKKKENSTEENIVEKENNNKEITQGILIEKQNEKIIKLFRKNFRNSITYKFICAIK